jgi:hypothetical protein
MVIIAVGNLALLYVPKTPPHHFYNSFLKNNHSGNIAAQDKDF